MTFLRPVAMAKVGLVGLKEDRDVVLSVLHDLGILQVEPLSRSALEILAPDRGGEAGRKVAEQLLRFRGLRSALPPQPGAAPRSFRALTELLAAAARVTIDTEVGQLVREDDGLVTELKLIDDSIDLLERFPFFTGRLENLQTRHALAFFGEADSKRYPELREALGGIAEGLLLEGPAQNPVRFIVAVPNEGAEALARVAQQRGVRLVAAPRLEGTVEQATVRLGERRKAIAARREFLHASLEEIARRWYAPVAALEEGFIIENRKFEVLSQFGSGRASFAVEGWVPRRELSRLERDVARATADRTHVFEIPTAETAPTLMDNPPGVRLFEFFIRFYSLPDSSGWDPTWIFAVAFPLFFGFMLGDWGYGLTILFVSLWMMAGFPGGSRLPRFLRSFPKLLMSPKSMQKLAATLVPGCLIAIGFGLYFGEFFGFQVPWGWPLHRSAPLDPLVDLGKLLLLAGYIGLVMVVTGFTLGALNDYYHHHRGRAVARVGGIFFALGIAGVGLALLHGAYWPPTGSLLLLLEYVATFGGVALLLAGEGGFGIMGIIEAVSHVLSYTRLVGILLSSVILAFLIDRTAEGLFSQGPVTALIAAVLLIFGQGFIVVLGVFEPGIQGARLIFVEHFSKFFEGNGHPFRPFGSKRVHTLPTYGTPFTAERSARP